MTLTGLASISAAVAFFGCLVIGVFAAAKLLFIGLHLTLRRKGLAEEQARLAYPLPPSDALPHVVVQLPVYNEGEIVKRAISAAAALDWPKDKLHIQICDDSTDDTTEHAKSAMQALANSGIDIAIFRRDNRDAFKAGSLKAAMEKIPYEYFAIFDADYLPPRDFLRRCMAVLLSDSKFAFVQARAEFLNRDENALTRTQALELDAHYAVEQATRSWAGLPLPFNGTCGIWRRAGIDAGGGWQGKTLAEDMELSYAAWLKGWRGIFVTSVAVPGELPADRKSWTSQQNRWMTGNGQVIRTILPQIWRDRRLSAIKKFIALSNIAMWWLGAAVNIVLVTTALAIFLNPELIASVAPVVLLVLFCLLVILFVELRLGNRLLRAHQRSLPGFFLDFLFYICFTLYKLCLHARSAYQALSSHKPEFARTPKRGVEETHF